MSRSGFMWVWILYVCVGLCVHVVHVMCKGLKRARGYVCVCVWGGSLFLCVFREEGVCVYACVCACMRA